MSGKGKGKRSSTALSTNGHNGNAKHLKTDGDSYSISPKVLEQTDLVKQAWGVQDKEIKDDNILLVNQPFTCCSIKDFLSSKKSVEALVAECADLEFLEKNNDLYKFKQSSSDLKSSDLPGILGLRNFLLQDVRPWLEGVTGIKLDEDRVDMFCARYDYTDYLLCHDDELEGRRIAYIMYLVPESWEEADGGSLDLFDTLPNGHPNKVVRSILPSRNALAFFEVTPKSYHQVAEVLSKDKTRLSIGGWFHGETIPRSPLVSEPPQEAKPPLDIEEEEFYSWINPVYLDPGNQMEIRENFKDSSEISLPNLLAEEMHDRLCQVLRQQELDWKTVGPANKRRYEVATEDESMHPLIKRCLHFLRSDAMFLLLSGVTGLKLHPLAEVSDDEDDDSDDDTEKEEGEKEPKACSSQDMEDSKGDSEKEEKSNKSEGCNPKCHAEVRRWSPGSYTLIRDCDADQREFRLDARLFLNCRGWSGAECGGFSSYCARGEDEELLSALPEENTLAVVYRDADTLGFVKCVTDEARNKLDGGCFHDISLVYYE